MSKLTIPNHVLNPACREIVPPTSEQPPKQDAEPLSVEAMLLFACVPIILVAGILDMTVFKNNKPHYVKAAAPKHVVERRIPSELDVKIFEAKRQVDNYIVTTFAEPTRRKFRIAWSIVAGVTILLAYLVCIFMFGGVSELRKQSYEL